MPENEKEYKYRVEFSKPTTGGVEGFSVRASGDDIEEVMTDAMVLQREARLSTLKEEKD